MQELQVATRSGGAATVKGAAIEKLSSAVKGRVLLPGNGDYDSARTIWKSFSVTRPVMWQRRSNLLGRMTSWLLSKAEATILLAMQSATAVS